MLEPRFEPAVAALKVGAHVVGPGRSPERYSLMPGLRPLFRTRTHLRPCQTDRQEGTMPLFGPSDVAELKAKRDIPGLIEALGDDEDARVRCAAADALGDIGDPLAVEPLIGILSSEHETVRMAAAEALGKIGAPAIPPLIAAHRSGGMYRRAAAVKALVLTGDDRAVKPLLASLRDYDWLVRRTAAEGLVTMFRAGTLDQANQVQILAYRVAITNPHNDRFYEPSDYDHGDHVDWGTDVKFPEAPEELE